MGQRKVVQSPMRVPREKLASLLWPDATEPNARGYLRRALWQIRKCLESGSLAGEDYLRCRDISVTFNDQSDYWLDADFLLTRMEARPSEEIIEIVRLYRVELLLGFYDEWITVERALPDVIPSKDESLAGPIDPGKALV